MINQAASPLHELEIAFWDSFNRILSENVTVRRAIRELSRLAHTGNPLWVTFIFSLCAASGLSIGYVIGSFVH